MLMYFIVFAVTMLFAGFTSAYIVSNMGQFWVHSRAEHVLGQQRVDRVEQCHAVVGHPWVKSQANQGIVGLALTLLLSIGFTVTQAEAGKTWPLWAWVGTRPTRNKARRFVGTTRGTLRKQRRLW